MGKVSVFPALGGVLGRDDNVKTIKIAAEKRVIEIGAHFNVYTDGLQDGGAGVVVTRRNLTSPEVVKTRYDREVPASLVPIRTKIGPGRKRYTNKG